MRGLSQYQFFFRAFFFVVIVVVAFGTYRTITNPTPDGSSVQTMSATEAAVVTDTQREESGLAASKQSTSGRWVALATLLCLTVLALAMLVVLWRMRTAMRVGMVATEGVVVGAVQYDDGESNLFYPMVEFQTAAGETIRFRGHIGTAFVPPYKVGDRVKVFYHPAQPRSAIIDR
ncbi:DUF3592 domain-containing protein [Chloroflexus sp.]|uniref:DUF3592 domain-containing protein n=1 Tax=Chloroflexus sp. TaxID=1904827 RepID=UPI002ACD3663|nr:DUF3592 domain-containing protein [Chloroflexus sp.]